MDALLDLYDLTVELPTSAGWISPVREVSFQLGRGESLGLVGESGSGKTMLALALVGLLPQSARRHGQAWLAGGNGSPKNRSERVDLASADEAELRAVRGSGIGFVFQEPMTALNPVMRIGPQIAEAVCAHRPELGAREIRKRTFEALERAHVPDPQLRARQYPHQLSGGLRQRVMIAIAVAAGPRLLIADEPTTALDATVQKGILELLASLRAELDLSLLFITHDLGVVAQVAGRVAVMYAGRIVEIGPTSEILRHPRHPYTEALLRASPRMDRGGLAPIPGTVPPPNSQPPGCAFAPRCDYRKQECSARMPGLRPSAPDHFARCVLVPEVTAESVRGKR